MATPNRHQHINCNNSGSLTIDSSQVQVSDLANYELAYHHHLQTALQMGQFYTPEQLSHSSAAAAAAAAAALRSSTSSASGSLRLVDSGGPPTQTNCHSIWDNNSRGQRGSMAYHHPHGAADLLSVTNTLQCDIWPTTTTTSLTNGRLQNSGHPQRFGGSKSSSKKPRRRVATIAQRRAANIRERRRMFNLNEAFDKLRRKVPTFAYEKRLSRIETLRLAITYISFMRDLMIVPDPVKSTSSGSNERVGKISQSHQNNNGHINHNHCQYTSNTNNNAVLGMDCLQNQNVPPPMSPFNPMGRLYSPHAPQHPHYLASGIPQ